MPRDETYPGETQPTATSTDSELLARVADGSTNALEELYGRHVSWLTLRLSRRCSDELLVEEVVQDVFVAVWRGAGRFDGRAEVGAWLWTIAIRRLIDALRKRPGPMAHLPHYGHTGSVTESAEDRVLLGVQHGDLGGALDRLSPELRAVVQATVLDGLTSREAGRLLKLPTGTVKTRMMRARAALREDLA